MWIGWRLVGAQVIMPSSTILVVSPEFVRRVASGQVTDRQASATISQALGHVEVVDSALVNLLEAYCAPWRLVQVLTGVVGQFAAQHATFRCSWKIRWIVFGVAIVDNYLNDRWPAFVGVSLITVLSWTTGHLHNRWARRSQDLGEQRATSEGLGPGVADLMQRGHGSLGVSERAERVCRGTPDREVESRCPTVWRRAGLRSATR
ncbi:MAG: hypothetical protein IT193_16605 [Propionibacteriaceae bacterium]|nr:hypothetical protein [Propionibacteriaceae bacterium]